MTFVATTNGISAFNIQLGGTILHAFQCQTTTNSDLFFFLQLFITNGLSIKSSSFVALGLTGKHWNSEALNGLGYRENTFASSRE